MSSWERARFIPWSKIPHDGTDLSDTKERIQRDLQREADKEEKNLQQMTLNAKKSGVASDDESIQDIKDYTIPFRWGELGKNAVFGGTIGAITGCVFGFMDGMNGAGKSDVLMKASNVAKGKFILQGMTRSATVFGVFFGSFHMVKYGLRVAAQPGEWGEIGIAGAISLGTLMSRPALRPSMPYASMLVIMDGVHIVMREFND
ncbi:MAG: hypothetical protein SGBAC_007238 [Bacillariaceae sp.]